MIEKYNFKLLVEGKDDQHVIWALCQEQNIPETFDVIDCNSVENAIKQFQFRLEKSSNTTQRLAIIVDADLDLHKRWESIKMIINQTGNYQVPDIFPQEGLIINTNDGNGIRIGVWIMPDNQLTGMLEDFMSRLVDDNDPLFLKADKILVEIENENLSRYKSIHKSKARIHTWLSWQETPGVPMGLAITKHYLSTEKELCQKFISWLNLLFYDSNDKYELS